MPKFRDAETGNYISKEEAESRDRATWVEESDDVNVDTLKDIYRRCKNNSITPTNSFVFNNTTVISLDKLRDILNEYGADITD